VHMATAISSLNNIVGQRVEKRYGARRCVVGKVVWGGVWGRCVWGGRGGGEREGEVSPIPQGFVLQHRKLVTCEGVSGVWRPQVPK
jgi:hypothetical protein